MTRIVFCDTETTSLRPDRRALGIEISDEDRHTALGDARWARAIHDRVTGANDPVLPDGAS